VKNTAISVVLFAALTSVGTASGMPILSSGVTGFTTNAAAAIVTVGVDEASITGSALRFTGNSGQAATNALGITVNTAKLLISFDLKFDAGQIDGNDFLGFWLGNSGGPNIGLKGNCGGAAGCSADLFVRTQGVEGSFATMVTLDTTYHLVALLEKASGSSYYDRYSLWVDPTSAELATFTGADAVFNASSGVTSFSSVGFRTANLDQGDVLLVENINIYTVPVPSSAALAAVALCSAYFAAYRRRRGVIVTSRFFGMAVAS